MDYDVCLSWTSIFPKQRSQGTRQILPNSIQTKLKSTFLEMFSLIGGKNYEEIREIYKDSCPVNLCVNRFVNMTCINEHPGYCTSLAIGFQSKGHDFCS